MLIRVLLLSLIFLMLQACTSIKEPYLTILNTPPSIIQTSVGNVEVWNRQTKQSSKGSVYFIPGFPGSSLENIPLGHELFLQGYSVHLINPPGHGRIRTGNADWRYHFSQYGRSLFDSINTLQTDSSSTEKTIIIAHSAGAEMVIQWLLLKTQKGNLPKHTKLIFINPWLPSISNTPIAWTKEDDDLLDYSPWLVKLFGPFSKNSVYQRLFTDPRQKETAEYIEAHNKLTEDFWGWGAFDFRFVNLMRGTTRTQRSILRQSTRYELANNQLAQLNRSLTSAKVKILIINSSGIYDKIIPSSYKKSLQKALQAKLPSANIQFTQLMGGHMLQVEKNKQLANQISHFLMKS